jgi:hypothetical protein
MYIEITADIQATATHPENLTEEERRFLEEGSK